PARSIFARRISGRRVAYSHPHITKVHAINARTGGIIPCSYTGRLFRASYADRTPSLCKVSIGALTDPELQVSLAGSQLDRVGLRGGVGFDPALGFVNRRNVSHVSATAGYLLLTASPLRAVVADRRGRPAHRSTCVCTGSRRPSAMSTS